MILDQLTRLLIHVGQVVDDSGINIPNKNIVQNSGDKAALTPAIQTVLQIVFGTMGAISVLIITIAGFQYVISSGDPQRVAKSKDAIIYAVIGLVIAIMAFTIVTYVMDNVFG